MTWTVEFDTKAAKEFIKLPPDIKKIISEYLNNKLATSNNLKALGKSLKYGYVGLWRYRVGKYRIICNIEEDKLVVLVLKIGKRDSVYK